MLRRSSRATLAAAARYFSTEAAATETAEKAVRRGGDTLGRRIFSLVYSKRSAVIAIRKWKTEGHKVQKYQLNRIVRELRKMKRYKHALEVCEWMTQERELKLLPGDYAVHLDLVAKVRGLTSAEKFFEDLPDEMRGWQTCTALLHTYVKCKDVVKAEALMEKMRDCSFVKNPLPYNHMISLYIADGEFDKAKRIVEELKKSTTPDVVTFNLWLSMCASLNDVESAKKVLLELKKLKIEADWITYSTLTNLYLKNKLLEDAVSTLKEMEKRASRKNRLAYSSLLSLYTNMGDKDAVHRIWNKMKSLFCKMNDAEYTCMLSSLIKLEEIEKAENLYTEWESVSGTGDPQVANILLAAYINRNQIEDSENFYRRMVEKGVCPCYTTWELLTWGHLKTKQMEKVLDCFKKAITIVKTWSPDKRLVREVFKILEEKGNAEGAEEFLVMLRNAGYVSTEIYNSLLRTYAKAGKMPLIVTERMKKDGVELDEETHRLIKTTSSMRVSEVSSFLS
ncbi:pentatricopeptide repeat-containing protein At4g02820, mitochondrial [Ricinus communis]|uniref:pentatricopeptide repeat-containing protein At4g02820, mitochondrial n=1 Tax=Ricinus communis TaxID=3988 RepID=UPI00077275D7|nr:pentatricopeptide repeat-containing protein At4g02820, mitochondrial [Ricinus communis]|eukprot:XP_015575612.1 pentatricopeptide repeat-containing protein At4g02820, mitochondrial [Ricinus communis]